MNKFLLAGILLLNALMPAQKKTPQSIIEQSNTANMVVGVDQFGRSFDAVSSYKQDKQVGLFFWLWIGQPYASGIYDATKIAQMPDGNNLLYNFNYLNDSISPNHQAHFWGEPLWGYYNSEDEWVIRRQIQMLTIAGIDFIVFDATNYSTFKNVYLKVLRVIDEFIKNGWTPPKIAFYTHSRSTQTTEKLYKELYKEDIYPDSWYRINGKPLIIAYTKVEDDINEAKLRDDKNYKPSELSQEILDYFYFKKPQWPFDPVYSDGFPWVEWSFPQPLHTNMMSVTVASHPNVPMSRSITHGVENWGRGWDPVLKSNIKENVDRGTFFQLQWDHALKVNPDLIFVGGWNEWIAIKQPWGDEYMLCDAASKEFSRDIEPMKGGYNDAFYIQMIQNIRKYKGINDSLRSGEFKSINFSDRISQWDEIKNVYLNSDNKMQERNEYGASKTVRYIQSEPRNKLLEIKVCNDENYLNFYIRAENNLTAEDGHENWMNLFLGTGSPTLKGWDSYEYVIGRKSENGKRSIEKLGSAFVTSKAGWAEYSIAGNIMQIKVPRKVVEINSGVEKIYFKVADGVQNQSDIMDYYVSGVSLPPGRLSYQYNIAKNSYSGKTFSPDKPECRDIFPDTWVGTDALGRNLPTSPEAGPMKNDQPRTVGIFYVTWHRDKDSGKGDSYIADISKILQKDPNARFDAKNPLWKKNLYYHWGEPEMGYFLSRDEYIIRKDMSMLTDAGVDVIIMDVTNSELYWDEWITIFNVLENMKAEGNKVPKFCFWAFNGPVISVVQELFDKLYKGGKYRDLWFYWEGKPLLLYNNSGVNDVGKIVPNPNPHYDLNASVTPDSPHYKDPDYTEKYYVDYTKEVKNFFTKRNMWWGFYEWNGKRFIGTNDNWSYGYQMNDERINRMPINDLVSRHDDVKEEGAVTPAQHATSLLSMVGKSWSRKNGEPQLNQYDLPDSSFIPWLGKTVSHPEGYGIYFQERWDEVIAADPQFVYLNDWNEWKACIFQIPDTETTPFMRRNNSYFFVDQYNSEFNRDIQPMKGGYTDNYYMQMAENIRRYKGVNPIAINKEFTNITLNKDFADWDNVKNEYRDTKGDIFHRNYNGYYGSHYADTSGRNDIITSKVAVDKNSIYFYAETNDTISASTGNNWMLLLIDADKNPNTGWYGYDFIVNKSIIDDKTTTLMSYDSNTQKWVYAADLNYNYGGKKLEIVIPRKLLGLKEKNAFELDFHWCDNPADLIDPISLCTSGDSAPNRRFNYRFSWKYE